MMLFLRGLFDRLFLVTATVAGGLVPGFIAQYRQRLGGRLDQARLDLEPWQRIADQFYQGDIGKLIQYHLDSKDATFHLEGSVIQSLIATVQRLQGAVDALHGNLFHQLAVWLLFHACWRLIGLGSRGLLGATQAPRSGRQSPDGFRAHRIQRRAGPGTEP